VHHWFKRRSTRGKETYDDDDDDDETTAAAATLKRIWVSN
jgi:hypothetical protein